MLNEKLIYVLLVGYLDFDHKVNYLDFVVKKSTWHRQDSMKKASRARPEVRSAAILQAALEEFAQEGYAAARMENIAARAGVTKGLIYFYYKNKQALFEAMFSECIREPLRGNLLDTDPARSMASHLARGLFNIYHNLMDASFFGQLARLILLEGHRFPEIHAYYYREVLTPIMDILRGFLDEGVRRGEWKAEVVPEFLHILLAPGILFALWRLSLGQYKNLDLERYCREHQRSLLRSLGLDEAAVETALSVAASSPVRTDPDVEPPYFPSTPPSSPTLTRRTFTARAALRRRPGGHRPAPAKK